MRQRVEAEQGGGCSSAAPGETMPAARHCSCTSCTTPPLAPQLIFIPAAGAAGITRLLLLNGGHVGAGSEEVAALVVTAHKGAAELFSGQ